MVSAPTRLHACVCADGQKIFQSEFIGIIHPGANLIGQLEFNLLNSSVALFGYYLAAFTIDRPWMGRRRMQVGQAPQHTLPPGHECLCMWCATSMVQQHFPEATQMHRTHCVDARVRRSA